MATKETPNLRNVMEFVARRPTSPPAEPTLDTPPQDAPPPVAEESPAAPIAEVEPTRKNPDTERKGKIKKQRGATDEPAVQTNYTEAFLVPVRGRKPKTIYVDDDTHEALSVITRSAGGVGLSDLVINIVNHHFEVYGKDIRSFLNSVEDQKKKRLPY